MTPTLSAIATSVPSFQFSLADAKRCLAQVIPLSPERLARTALVFDHAGVERRFSAYPIEYLVRRRPLEQVSREYREQAIAIGRRVALASLARAGLDAGQIDLLVTVSCTGVMLPSLDAYLINDLGFRRDVRRLPITELGCAAGVAALAQARDFALAHPPARVLVVSVEFPSLTFQGQDASMANLVSCAVFGDGAAAALVDGADGPGIRVVDSLSHLFPDSYDALGFDLADGGLHIVLGKHVADLIHSGLRDAVERLLRRHDLDLADIGFAALHPGGKKLLVAAEDALGMARTVTQPAWDVLREYGNLSSAAVFFVLERLLADAPPRPGDLGLMIAFGPGFSAELLLLQCA